VSRSDKRNCVVGTKRRNGLTLACKGSS
jgi:hypothetical protein